MKAKLATVLASAGLLASVLPASSETVIFPGAVIDTVPQGQKFYSERVSRVSNGLAQACMVSTGTDWKGTAQVRRAVDVEPLLDGGASYDDAFARTEPVDIAGLSSNTPFLSFVISADKSKFLRVATGFSMKPGSVELRQDGRKLDTVFGIERRSDTGVVLDSTQVETLLSDFAEGAGVQIIARSTKQGGIESEHVIAYDFVGGFDETALVDCMNDLAIPENALPISTVPFIEMTPMADADVSDRVRLRAMACNRDLNPDETEVMRLTGPNTGFSSPLSAALIERADDGKIQNIWSGDLWRISRTETGYDLAFSNSVTRQGPLEPQEYKACTRFSEAQCATLNEREDGAIEVTGCFGTLLAAAGVPTDGFLPGGTIFAGTPSGGGGGTPGGSTPVSTIVTGGGGGGGGTPPGVTPPGGGNPPPAVVPVPPAGVLLLSALGLFGLRRRFGRQKA